MGRAVICDTCDSGEDAVFLVTDLGNGEVVAVGARCLPAFAASFAAGVPGAAALLTGQGEQVAAPDNGADPDRRVASNTEATAPTPDTPTPRARSRRKPATNGAQPVKEGAVSGDPG